MKTQQTPLPVYRVIYSDGTSYITNMSKTMTLEKARAYFLDQSIEQPDGTFKMVADVQGEIPMRSSATPPASTEHSPLPVTASELRPEPKVTIPRATYCELKANAQRLADELERCRDLVIAYRAAYCTSYSDDADAAIKSGYQALQDFGVPNAQKGGQQ